MDEIWKQFSQKLRGEFRKRVSEEDIDDLLQELFLKVLKQLDQMSHVRNVEAWLRTMARHLAIDHLRKQQRHQKLFLDHDVAQPPLEKNIYRTLSGCLNNSLKRLPENYQQVMGLLLHEEQSQVQIAKSLGLSTSGAKSRVQRGRKLLKEELQKCCRFHFDASGQLTDVSRGDGKNCQCG